MKEKLAELFRIAREEGALRKYANGESDAGEVISLLKEEIGRSLLTENEIWGAYGIGIAEGDVKGVAEAQLDKVLKILEGDVKG